MATVNSETHSEHIKQLKLTGTNKGVAYFQNFHNTFKKPWFHNLKIKRELITLVNRCRSGHYNLNAFLFKIKVVDSPQCDCAFPIQDSNHVLWDCTLFSEIRKQMYTELR